VEGRRASPNQHALYVQDVIQTSRVRVEGPELGSGTRGSVGVGVEGQPVAGGERWRWGLTYVLVYYYSNTVSVFGEIPMDLHQDTHSPTPIRRRGAEPRTNVIEGGDLPRSPALPSIPELVDSSEITPNAVTRAIEDLKRSGYRPLRARPAALPPLSRSSPGPARHGVDGEADSMPGGSYPGEGERIMSLVMFLVWVLVGLLAGGLAEFVMKGGGYGVRADLVLGLIGSLVGSVIFWVLETSPETGMVGVASAAFGGAATLIIGQRKIWPVIA
jgi:uncharacterized membrane protein YeaQ/YmgE (transglycosylase-associated protein family)